MRIGERDNDDLGHHHGRRGQMFTVELPVAGTVEPTAAYGSARRRTVNPTPPVTRSVWFSRSRSPAEPAVSNRPSPIRMRSVAI